MHKCIISNLHRSRNKSGIWGWRSDKVEEVNTYECKVNGNNSLQQFNIICYQWMLSIKEVDKMSSFWGKNCVCTATVAFFKWNKLFNHLGSFQLFCPHKLVVTAFTKRLSYHTKFEYHLLCPNRNFFLLCLENYNLLNFRYSQPPMWS